MACEFPRSSKPAGKGYLYIYLILFSSLFRFGDADRQAATIESLLNSDPYNENVDECELSDVLDPRYQPGPGDLDEEAELEKSLAAGQGQGGSGSGYGTGSGSSWMNESPLGQTPTGGVPSLVPGHTGTPSSGSGQSPFTPISSSSQVPSPEDVIPRPGSGGIKLCGVGQLLQMQGAEGQNPSLQTLLQDVDPDFLMSF